MKNREHLYQSMVVFNDDGTKAGTLKVLKDLPNNWIEFLTQEERDLYFSLSEIDKLSCQITSDPFKFLENKLLNLKVGVK